MDVMSSKSGKKGLITKTWERCKSIGGGRGGGRKRNWSFDGGAEEGEVVEPEAGKRTRKCRVAPEGCFSVYVGPQRQRFVIKAECANHPLFRLLLEEAELEYGYNCDGPLALPCDVDLFYKVLGEIDRCDDDDDESYDDIRRGSRSFSKS